MPVFYNLKTLRLGVCLWWIRTQMVISFISKIYFTCYSNVCGCAYVWLSPQIPLTGCQRVYDVCAVVYDMHIGVVTTKFQHPISKSLNKRSLCMFRICIQIFWLANISIKCAMVIAVEIQLDWVVLTVRMFINEAMKSVEYIYVCVRVCGREGVNDVTIEWWMYCRKCDTRAPAPSNESVCQCAVRLNIPVCTWMFNDNTINKKINIQFSTGNWFFGQTLSHPRVASLRLVTHLHARIVSFGCDFVSLYTYIELLPLHVSTIYSEQTRKHLDKLYWNW